MNNMSDILNGLKVVLVNVVDHPRDKLVLVTAYFIANIKQP